MNITNQDLVFASILGINSVGSIQRLKLVQNELSKRVLPNIPFLPVSNDDHIESKFYNPDWKLNQADAPIPESQQFFPLSFSFTENGQKWLFPFEPMINISSGNNIVKRNVAKQGNKLIGTVKERWSRKDFDIQVTGALIGSMLSGKVEDCFPKAQMIALFDYLKYNKEIFIYCYPLEILRVTKAVIEDYSFPFTKGENVQAYDIKLISDYSYNLLVKDDTF